MSTAEHDAYEFGQFTLAPAEKRLVRDGKVVPLAPKVFDTLLLLVKNQGRLMEKDELLKTLWPHSIVEEVALAHNVSQLRKILGDTAEDPKFIETVPKRGYRFIAAVRLRSEPPGTSPSGNSAGDDAPSAMRPAPLSRFAIVGALVVVLLLAAAAYQYLSPTGESTAEVPPAIHSLAVLPFQNLSGDKEQDYFTDGMTDELITELGSIGALRVVSRTSAMQYKGTRKPLRNIANELKVDAVVEGTVLRSGNRVRITAQLIAATSDRHLWAQSYERDLSDVLVLQDDVSRDIAAIIRVKATPQQRAMPSEGHAVNPEAHDAYLRGRYWLSGNAAEPFASGENMRKGLEYFQKAVAIDPNYALAYAGIADSLPPLGHGKLDPKSKDAALRALQLDPSLAEAHASLAKIKYEEWDWSGAEREFKEALALNPNYVDTHLEYTFYLFSMGRLDEAVQEAQRAYELDPFSFGTNLNLGEAFYYARRYDDALRQLRRGLEIYPDNGVWNCLIAMVYDQRKMFAEAYEQIHQSISLNKETEHVAAIEQAYKRSGYRGVVLQLIQFPNPFLAHQYAVLGDDAAVMLYLERAYDEHYLGLTETLLDPALDRLRGSARFGDLIRRLGLPPSVNRVFVGDVPDHELQ